MRARRDARLIDALRRVHDAGGAIELASLARELRLSRSELDRLLAYADDERRGLVRVHLDAKTGVNVVALTAAGARRLAARTAVASEVAGALHRSG